MSVLFLLLTQQQKKTTLSLKFNIWSHVFQWMMMMECWGSKLSLLWSSMIIFGLSNYHFHKGVSLSPTKEIEWSNPFCYVIKNVLLSFVVYKPAFYRWEVVAETYCLNVIQICPHFLSIGAGIPGRMNFWAPVQGSHYNIHKFQLSRLFESI